MWKSLPNNLSRCCSSPAPNNEVVGPDLLRRVVAEDHQGHHQALSEQGQQSEHMRRPIKHSKHMISCDDLNATLCATKELQKLDWLSTCGPFGASACHLHSICAEQDLLAYPYPGLGCGPRAAQGRPQAQFGSDLSQASAAVLGPAPARVHGGCANGNEKNADGAKIPKITRNGTPIEFLAIFPKPKHVTLGSIQNFPGLVSKIKCIQK